jgi:energy-coupling factor transporter ATP-binding protein EcfA2
MNPDFSAAFLAQHHLSLMGPLEKLQQALAAVNPLHEGPDGPIRARLSHTGRLAERLLDRLEWGPQAPLLVAVLGATGTGKSKIFNTLAGRPISPSGYRRPTTMAPVMLWAQGLGGGMERPRLFPGVVKRATSPPASFQPDQDRELVIVTVGLPGLDRTALVDTPDFDSVLEKNRRMALELFERADAVVFVTDSAKYADQASWDYLDRIRDTDKPALLVINRLKSTLSLEDFRRRLMEAGLDRPLVGLAEEPGLADADPLPERLTGLADIRNQLAAWQRARTDLLAGAAGRLFGDLTIELNEGLAPELATAREEVDHLTEALARSANRTAEELGPRLGVAISTELRRDLIGRIQSLFLKWDLLRYPRRIMALPFTLVRDKVLVPWGLMAADSPKESLQREIDRLFEANREALAASVQELGAEVTEQWAARTVGRGLMVRDDWAGLALSSEDIRQRYALIRADLESWVQGEAQTLVQGLNLGEKMTFYLAQGVSLGLFISIQVHTGGGFSFVDGVLDGVLAPILSKLTGAALSRDKVKAFETRAAEKHLSACRDMIHEQARAYSDRLNQAGRGLMALDALIEVSRDLDRAGRGRT